MPFCRLSLPTEKNFIREFFTSERGGAMIFHPLPKTHVHQAKWSCFTSPVISTGPVIGQELNRCACFSLAKSNHEGLQKLSQWQSKESKLQQELHSHRSQPMSPGARFYNAEVAELKLSWKVPNLRELERKANLQKESRCSVLLELKSRGNQSGQLNQISVSGNILSLKFPF